MCTNLIARHNRDLGICVLYHTVRSEFLKLHPSSCYRIKEYFVPQCADNFPRARLDVTLQVCSWFYHYDNCVYISSMVQFWSTARCCYIYILVSSS